jgi:hypothetical protein
MLRKLAALIAMVLLLMTTGTVHASCAEELSVQEKFQRMEAIFSGEVESVGTYTIVHELLGIRPPLVKLTVLEAWKGVTTSSVTIDNMMRTSVEAPLEQGQQYLVYSYRDSETGRLATNGCLGTKLLAGAATDLRELGPPTIVLQVAPAHRGSVWVLPAAISLLVLAPIVLFMRRQRRSR